MGLSRVKWTAISGEGTFFGGYFTSRFSLFVANTFASTKDGIDLCDEAGRSCLVQKRALGSDNLVTVLVSRLVRTQENLELGMRLVQLWKQETGLDWTKTATEVESELDQTDSISYSEVEEDVNSGTSKDNAEYVYPKSFFTGNGARTCSERLEEEKNGFLSRTLLSGSTKETFPASPHKVRLSRECS